METLELAETKYVDSKCYYQMEIEGGWLLRVYKDTFDEVAQERSKLLNEPLEASIAWLRQPDCWLPYLSDPAQGVWICRK